MKPIISSIFHFKYLILAFFFCQNIVYSACIPKKLLASEIKQTHSSFFDADSVFTAVFELDTSHFIYSKLVFNKVSDFDTIFIQFFKADPCTTSGQSPQAEYNTLLKSLTIQYKEEYKFIKVRTSGRVINTFSIKTFVFQDIEHCSNHENKYNKFETPTNGPSLDIGNNSFDLCSNNCDSYSYNLKGYKQNVDKPVKWVQFPISGQAILNIQCSGSKPKVICYGIRGENTFFIKTLDFDSIGHPNYLQVTGYNFLRLGIYNEGTTSDFQLSIFRYPYKNSCIDFFNEGQSLEVITTSKGSSTRGPFLFGEEVTFEYKIIDWMPIGNNWIHGLNVLHGSGWKGLKHDEKNRLEVLLDEGYVLHDSLNYNNQIKFIKSDSLRYAGFNVKNLLTPGFYFDNPSSGPTGPTPNYKWGKRFDRVRGSLEDPLFKFKFTLVADSIGDCSRELDGFVDIIPFTDFQTGRYDISGCTENPPVETTNLIKCCESNILHSFVDTTLCHGDNFYFTDFTSDSASYQILYPSAAYAYNLNKISYQTRLTVFNETNTIDTLRIKVLWNEGESCADSVEFQIFVRPNERNLNLDFSEVCKNQRVNLSQKLRDSLDHTVSLSQSELTLFDTYKDDGGDIWISSFKSESQVIPLNSLVYCGSNVALRYSPSDCLANEQKNENSQIDIQAVPNPTFESSDLIINNMTESTNWNLSVFDDKGIMIRTSNEFFPQNATVVLPQNMALFPPGIYYFHLTDGSVVISKKIIKLIN